MKEPFWRCDHCHAPAKYGEIHSCVSIETQLMHVQMRALPVAPTVSEALDGIIRRLGWPSHRN